MIFHKFKKGFIDKLFDIKEEEQKHMQVVMSSDDKKEQDKSWAKVKECGVKIEKLFKAEERRIPKGSSWTIYLVKELFKAVGNHGKEPFIRTLEIYGVGVVL